LQRAETGGAKQAAMSALQLGQFIAADTSFRAGPVMVCSETIPSTIYRLPRAVHLSKVISLTHIYKFTFLIKITLLSPKPCGLLVAGKRAGPDQIAAKNQGSATVARKKLVGSSQHFQSLLSERKVLLNHDFGA
jgi:hypothetical protein